MLIVLIIVVLFVPIFYFVIKANNRYWERQKALWEPHCKRFNGSVVKKYSWRGECDGTPVTWKIYGSGGGGGENMSNETYHFEIRSQHAAGGTTWQLYYNTPGLLNHTPEGWRLNAKDKAVEDALWRAGVKDLAAPLPRYFSARHNPKTGRIVCEHQVKGMAYVPPLDEFVRFVETLSRLGRINDSLASARP